MRILFALIFLLLCRSSLHAQRDSSFFVRTSGKLTMLSYGLGEDRLGGAKAGYIDTNVLLRVVDSAKDMYQVRLSQNHKAYISKSDVRPDTARKQRPFYLSNSWSVRGDEKYDYLNISLDERMPYKSWMEINPSKIFLEIYGVQSNTNWITQLKTVKEIKDVYFNQVEDDVMRVTIELNHKQHWGYSIGYRGKTLSMRIRRQPTSLKVSKLKIGIDAGHGGSNTGASGLTSKALEKNYTIRFASELQQVLEDRGAQVVMTRTSDTNINNVDRVLLLQQEMPDILISIHLNSSSNKEVKGVSTYYKHIGFRPLTTNILNRMLQLKLNEFGNIGHFNFALNAPTDFPNSLVEVAFLSNAEDEKLILDPRFHKAVAKKIYKGINDWLRQVRRSS